MITDAMRWNVLLAFALQWSGVEIVWPMVTIGLGKLFKFCPFWQHWLYLKIWSVWNAFQLDCFSPQPPVLSGTVLGGIMQGGTKSVHGKKWTEPAHPTLKQEWPPSIEWFHSKGSIKNRSTKIYQCEKFHLTNKNNVSALKQFEILIVLALRRLIWICWFVCVCGAAQVNVSKNAYTGRTHI